MDKVTESLLEEFSNEHGLGLLGESKRFEHFASYSVVKREHSETFDTSDLVVGDGGTASKDGGDTGIDGAAILVNGSLVTDVDDLAELTSNASYLDVSFMLIQAETTSGFDSSKIGTFGVGCKDLFNEEPQLKRNDKISALAEIVQEIYKFGSKFKKGNPVCRLYYVTTGKWTGEQAPEARIPGQLGGGQPVAHDLQNETVETIRILQQFSIFILPIVEAKRLLIDVAEKEKLPESGIFLPSSFRRVRQDAVCRLPSNYWTVIEFGENTTMTEL